MVLLCGVFFTLGYVMGRTQYGGAVHAADVLNGSTPSVPASSKSKPAPAAKNAPAPAPDNGGWDFYDNKKSASDHLEPCLRLRQRPRQPRPRQSRRQQSSQPPFLR